MDKRDLEIIYKLAGIGMSETPWSWHEDFFGFKEEEVEQAMVTFRVMFLDKNETTKKV